MENKNLIRAATHSGSWYESLPTILAQQFNTWLKKCGLPNQSNSKFTLKAIIGPHAGYSYSGPTAAYAYSKINPNNYERVFLLGPCHHKYIKGCGLTTCQEFETPFGNITIDNEIINTLISKKNFFKVSKRDEEDEHSLEMHLPFIKFIFGDKKFTLVPIMVGNLNTKLEEYFGEIFAEYLKDDKNLFIISSDFCHWGKGFDYNPYDKSDGEIWQSIEKLDKIGIQLIEEHNAQGFASYLEETRNTICGRHPISVFLNALQYSNLSSLTKTQLIFYTQSNQVKTAKQTSVSYAAISTHLI